MNKSAIMAILGSAILGVGRQSQKKPKGSQARNPYDSDKMKSRFYSLNGYSIDNLIEIALNSYVNAFMHLEPYYDDREKYSYDFPFLVTIFDYRTNAKNRMDFYGIDHFELKKRKGVPDFVKNYAVRFKVLNGNTVTINRPILTSPDYPLSDKEIEKIRTLSLAIENFFKEYKRTGWDNWNDFVILAINFRDIVMGLKSNMHVIWRSKSSCDLSLGFKIIPKNTYIKIRDIIRSDSRLERLFRIIIRETIEHEFFHIIEPSYTWKVVHHEDHGLSNYMSSRSERMTWGSNTVNEVAYTLQVFKEAQPLLEKGLDPTDKFYRPYYRYINDLLEERMSVYLILVSVRQLLYSYGDLYEETKELIDAGEFESLADEDEFIYDIFPLLRQKTFQHWKQMVKTYLKSLLHKGTLFLIGGRGDNPVGNIEIMKNFFDECSKSGNGTILIVTSGSQSEEAGKRQADTFRRMGGKTLIVSSSSEVRSGLYRNDIVGIFFTGGDQQRLMNQIRPLKDRIFALFDRGVHIAGTSAGAAIMSEKMIVGGDTEPIISEGLGLIKVYIIDQHFASRNRMGRLEKAIKSNGLRGIGLDEDTCLVVDETGYNFAIGSGKVYLLNPFNPDLPIIELKRYQRSFLEVF